MSITKSTIVGGHSGERIIWLLKVNHLYLNALAFPHCPAFVRFLFGEAALQCEWNNKEQQSKLVCLFAIIYKP